MKTQKDDPKGTIFFIFNHNNNHNSKLWLDRLTEVGMNAYILDSGSDTPPEGEHVIKYPNIFWTGMFKKAVNFALKGNFKWMFLVCDDILIGQADFNRLIYSLSVIYDSDDIGIYQPSTTPGSHCEFANNFNAKSNRLRTTREVEGYCMAIRYDILKKCEFLLNYDFEFGFGWGVDAVLCQECMKLGKRNVVDDSVRIYHPIGYPTYNEELARRERVKLFKDVYNESYDEHNNSMRFIFDSMTDKNKTYMTLLICICKNENDHMVEFIEYYKQLGVSQICIIDNNDFDGERIDDLVQKYVDEGFVIVENYRGQKRPQMRAYTECYRKYHTKFDWVMFFDFDEYLTFTEDKTISEYLGRPCFENFNMIHINWQIYNDNGYTHKQKGTLIDTFTTPIPFDLKLEYEIPENNHVKSIIRGGYEQLSFTLNPHTPSYLDLKCCNNAGVECSPQSPFCPYDFSLAYLKHFNTKSTEEYIAKLKRGFADLERTNYEKLIVSRYFGTNEITEEKVKMFNEAFNLDLNYLLKRYKGERSEKSKIYLLCYSKKNFDFVDDSVVRPLQVGAANGTEVCELKDNKGANISALNFFYTENTGTYWIWQNAHNCKYKGQMQYRRPLSGVNETMNFDEVFSKYDVITCVPFNHPANSKPTAEQPMFIPANTVEEGYAFSNCGDDLYILETFIKTMMPEYAEDYDKYIKHGENLYYSNGFILREEDFDKYCEFLFRCLNGYVGMAGITDYNSLLTHVKNNLELGKYIRYPNPKQIPQEAIIWQSHIGGFLSERIWTLWLLHNFPKEKILELPYIKQEEDKMYT